MDKLYLILFMIIVGCGMAFGQHAPPVYNYKVSDYKAHQQNWSIQQSSDSIMFFGNTDGLLSFNGNQWSIFKLKNKKTIRSIASVGDRIYAGAYGEIGYWQDTGCGNLNYHSLNELMPSKIIEKEEIWHIIEHRGVIYFQSFSVLLAYDGKTIKKIDLPGNIMFIHKIRGKLMFQVLDQGIFEITTENLIVKLPKTEFFNAKTVTSILPFGSSEMLITTNSNGVFIFSDGKIRDWNKTLNSHFSEVQINKAIITKEGYIVLGTIRDGLMVFDSNAVLMYHISSLNGLQNNTILSIYEDRNNNLWFGLDRGISIVHTREPAQRYYDDRGILGTVYTAAYLDSILYLGTNQGVYYFDQKQKESNYLNDFKLVKGTQGQVWDLKAYGGILFCGHNEGSFMINGAYSKRISNVNGGWYSSLVPNHSGQYIAQSTYTGFVIYKLNYNIEFVNRLDGFNIPIKKFIFDPDGNIWALGANEGFYRLKLSQNLSKIESFKKYEIPDDQAGGLRLDISINEGKVCLYTGDRSLVYNEIGDKFEADSKNKAIKTEGYTIKKIGLKYWVKIYVDSFTLFSDTTRMESFKLALNNEYNSIVEIGKNQLLYCLNEGYAISDIDFSSKKPSTLTPIHLSRIEYGDSSQCLPMMMDKPISIAFSDNHIKVHFYQTSFIPETQFFYKLEGEADTWKNVKDISFVELSNLKPNKYKLFIKSDSGEVLEPLLFTILPPWYLSKWAWFIYLAIIVACLKVLKVYFDRQLTEEKTKLEAENERLLREHKFELENDRLVQDNLLKSKELANATMHLVQKNELLQEIKEELIDVRKTGDHTLTTKDFQNLMKIINQNMTVEDDKNLFESNFNDVHDAFYRKLKTEFPELTVADLKLAAYLKMNLSSKEIAPLFNISIRGLENKRYRLRKKLGLPNDANLTEYFFSL